MAEYTNIVSGSLNKKEIEDLLAKLRKDGAVAVSITRKSIEVQYVEPSINKPEEKDASE